MIAGTITDVRDFMNQLLLCDSFDSLLLCEATLCTATTLSISGKLNMDFFDTGEKELLSEDTYASWAMVKPFVYHAVKGKKTPSSFKLVFLLPKKNQNALIMKYNLPVTPSDIAGLYFNVYFSNNTLSVTSGTSLKIFTTDKQVEYIWDESLKGFLASHHIHLASSL